MIVPYNGNTVAVVDETSSKRSNEISGTKAEKKPAKIRSASSNKQMDIIVPRFGVSAVHANDLAGASHPLAIMQEIMGGGIFEINPFEGASNSMGSPFGMKAEIFGIMGMQNFDQPTAGRGIGAKMISHTYVMKAAVGSDGKPYKEQYFSHNYAAKGKDGTVLSEKQQGYQNTNNKVQKIALEKTMNDKGRKMIKERIKGQGEERTHNFYYGIDEIEGDDFERSWNKKSEEMGFFRDFGRPLGYQNYNNSQPSNSSHLRNYNSENMRAIQANDYNANKYGLGYGGETQETATPKYYTNNNNRYEYENRTPQMTRTRTINHMPTMPTMSSRGVLVGSGISSLNSMDSRASFNRNIEPTNSYSNLENTRKNSERVSNSLRANYSGVDNNGTFKYKTPQYMMPNAG